MTQPLKHEKEHDLPIFVALSLFLAIRCTCAVCAYLGVCGCVAWSMVISNADSDEIETDGMSACCGSPFLASSKKTQTTPDMMGTCLRAEDHLFWRAARKRGQLQ